MTLGEKLKATVAELEQARIEGLEAQHNTDIQKVREQRNEIQQKLSDMRELFVQQIEAGKIPFEKIENDDWEKWIKSAANYGKAPHQDLWTEFRKFWADEGLIITVSDAHDGVGVRDWINVSLLVRAPGTRSSSDIVFETLSLGVYNG
jgi:hypothetical protein